MKSFSCSMLTIMLAEKIACTQLLLEVRILRTLNERILLRVRFSEPIERRTNTITNDIGGGSLSSTQMLRR